MIRNLTILLTLILIVMLSGCSQQEESKVSDQKSENFKIAYLSNKQSAKRKFDIFLTDTSGTQIKNLSKGRGDVRSFASPKFSPDQKYIFYTSEVNSSKFLNYIDLENDTVKTLTKLEVQNSKPIYSRLLGKVFFIDKNGKVSGLYSINFDGTNREKISDDVFDLYDFDLDQNTRSIVFSAKYVQSSSLFLYSLETKNITQLTDDQGDDKFPTFSSSGSEVLFSSSRNAEKENDFDIYLINVKSKEITTVYDSKYYDSDPKFFPDENRIAFLSNRRGMKYRDILVKSLESDEGKNLTMSLGILHQNYSISPGGNYIVFEFVQSINSEIYLVNVDTGKFKNISNDSAWDTSPTI